MARIRLDERETRASRLPDVCMVCGEQAESHIEKTFSWFPPWVGVLILAGLLPYLIVVMILTKRMRVSVPVCGRHSWYFGKRMLLIWLALLAWFGISGLVFVIGMAVADRQNEGTAVMASCFSFIVLLIVAIVVIIFVQNSTIRPKEITDDEITLISVHDRFADALDEFRTQRRSRRRDDDDDVEEPRPRRRPVIRDGDDEPRSGGDRFRERPPEDEPPRRRPRDYDD